MEGLDKLVKLMIENKFEDDEIEAVKKGVDWLSNRSGQAVSRYGDYACRGAMKLIAKMKH